MVKTLTFQCRGMALIPSQGIKVPHAMGPACHCRRYRRHGFDSWVGKIPCRRKWQPTPVFLPAKFYGQRNLVGYSPWGHRVGHD